MENYQVTIGYKAVIAVSVKAESEQVAKAMALEDFERKERGKWFKGKYIFLQDDSFSVAGAVNMDKSWNAI